MGVAIYSNGGNKRYGIKNIIVDSLEDLMKMGNTVYNYTPGSTAYVVDELAYYILNTEMKWKFFKYAATASIPTNEDIDIFDGEIDGGGAFRG